MTRPRIKTTRRYSPNEPTEPMISYKRKRYSLPALCRLLRFLRQADPVSSAAPSRDR